MKADSAMPEKIKHEILVNELLRRLTNTAQYLPNVKYENSEITNAYTITMKRSDYREKILRVTVLNAYKGLQEKLCMAQKQGGRLHRHMEEGEGDRHNA